MRDYHNAYQNLWVRFFRRIERSSRLGWRRKDLIELMREAELGMARNLVEDLSSQEQQEDLARKEA